MIPFKSVCPISARAGGGGLWESLSWVNYMFRTIAKFFDQQQAVKLEKNNFIKRKNEIHFVERDEVSVIPVMVFQLQLELQLVIFFIFQLQLLLLLTYLTFFSYNYS